MEPDFFSALLARLSAQFRGPMSSLYLAASRLAPAEERQQNPELDARAAALDQSYYQVLRLTNNLAAFQSLHEPALLMNQDIAALVTEVFDQLEGYAHYRSLTARLICPMEHYVCAFSQEGVQQVLWQLLSNAFKFTPPGGTVLLELARAHGQVLLSVADTGPGIPPEERAGLFQRWQPGRDVLPPHGAGLGLAICQGVARQHDGALTLDESYDKGCRFVFSFPDRRVNTGRFSDVQREYGGGFDPCLVALSDALPSSAFRIF